MLTKKPQKINKQIKWINTINNRTMQWRFLEMLMQQFRKIVQNKNFDGMSRKFIRVSERIGGTNVKMATGLVYGDVILDWKSRLGFP